MSSVKSVLVPDQVLGSDCDDYPRKTKTGNQECVSAKQGNGRRTVTWNIGVSPMGFNEFIMVNQELVQEPGLSRLYNAISKSLIPSQASFSRTRRSASELRECTSVHDRKARVFQRSNRDNGAERVLGYMTK